MAGKFPKIFCCLRCTANLERSYNFLATKLLSFAAAFLDCERKLQKYRVDDDG